MTIRVGGAQLIVTEAKQNHEELLHAGYEPMHILRLGIDLTIFSRTTSLWSKHSTKPSSYSIFRTLKNTTDTARTKCDP